MTQHSHSPEVKAEPSHDGRWNYAVHVGSLFFTKSADGLIDPKLVLSWLITVLGGSPAVVGLLVPVREAGALLPQLFTAGTIRKMPKRKLAWAAGCAVQGLAVMGIGLAALITSGGMISGPASGWIILAALAVFALARSICSVSYPDVLGRTIPKSSRGSATGLAASLAAISVVSFALLLSLDIFPRLSVVTCGLFLAGGLWGLAGGLFLSLKEEANTVEATPSRLAAVIENVKLLKTEPQLRRFIVVRSLLTATALAPPFMIAAASASSSGGGLQSFGGLGLLVISSALSALLSSFVWGRFADHSSRKVLVAAAVVSALALTGTAAAIQLGLIGNGFTLPLLLFTLMVAYQGVRLGRVTYLVNMATPQTRAAFTALSNTVIGVVLILGGGFGVAAALFGIGAVIWLMAALCACAAIAALRLDEVQ